MVFVSFLLLCGYPLLAHNGLFISPQIGAGISNATGTASYDMLDLNNAQPLHHITTINPALLVGYEHNNWIFSVGASYLTTGFKEQYSYFEYVNVNVSKTTTYTHYIFPAMAGYKFHLRRTLFMTTELGLAVAYNPVIREKGEENNLKEIVKYDNELSKPVFDFNYNRTNLWGIAKAQLGYSVSSKADIIIGPEFQLSITTITKPGGAFMPYINNERHYAATLNAGIVWHLNK